MVQFISFHGIIRALEDFPVGNDETEKGCFKTMTVEDETGEIVNFIISPSTYFVDRTIVFVGDHVTGYYDGNAPAPLIYPPQFQALIVVKDTPYPNVKVDHFNDQLISSDGQLRINIGHNTKRLLVNGQPYLKSPADRNLIVIYGASTKSIPAQTTPYEIIIWCG